MRSCTTSAADRDMPIPRQWYRHVPIADGFIIPLTFGADTDWCRNVLAAGQCTLQWHGLSYTVSRPEVVGVATVRPLVPSWGRPLVRVLQISQFLKVYRRVTR